jgi:hypothetical protein
MRHLVLAAAALATILTSACTHTHTVHPEAPLPEDETDHLRGALEGAGIGLLSGAALGGIVGYSAGDDEECSNGPESFFCLSFTAKEKAGIGAVYAGVPGAVLGLVLGAVIGSRDVYEYEQLPQITTVVTRDQASASVGWSF